MPHHRAAVHTAAMPDRVLANSGADTSATCPTRKRCYPSRTAAQRAMKSTTRGDHTPKVARRAVDQMNAYQCRMCDRWHIGHSRYLVQVEP